MAKDEQPKVKTTKTTVYLSDDLRRTVKKHLIDTGETLSKYTEDALRRQLEFDESRAGKKAQAEKSKVERLNDVIKDLAKGM